MFPSPSLGPPLLSLSWSPPLFCGIPDAGEPDDEDVLVAVVLELLAGAGDAALVELLDEPPPQPAAASAMTISMSPPNRLIDLDVSVPIGRVL